MDAPVRSPWQQTWSRFPAGDRLICSKLIRWKLSHICQVAQCLYNMLVTLKLFKLMTTKNATSEFAGQILSVQCISYFQCKQYIHISKHPESRLNSFLSSMTRNIFCSGVAWMCLYDIDHSHKNSQLCQTNRPTKLANETTIKLKKF